jgi:hypothetical protein
MPPTSTAAVLPDGASALGSTLASGTARQLAREIQEIREMGR